MVNNFFNSYEYITLLEASAIDGNKSATHYKLMSKTDKYLNKKQCVLTEDGEIDEKLIDEICRVIYDNMCSFTTAVESLGYKYNYIDKRLTTQQRIKISEAKSKFKVSTKNGRRWYV